ncbi:Ctf8-domain-containing protein [Lipomyces kononenkoae]|uniref:Ctf8-domain-containing protein n=1 Tax=Lipomyces kononenkoae TaxID=34357 RepID=A0ACC3SW43_LIPKO
MHLLNFWSRVWPCRATNTNNRRFQHFRYRQLPKLVRLRVATIEFTTPSAQTLYRTPGMPSATFAVNTRGACDDGSLSYSLPELLQTPTGLALIEIQGTLYAPQPSSDGSPSEIGRLTFDGNTAWLWIGEHQRMEGSVVDLDPPFGVLRRSTAKQSEIQEEGGSPDGAAVEIVEVIRKKILFASRPEPIVNRKMS